MYDTNNCIYLLSLKVNVILKKLLLESQRILRKKIEEFVEWSLGFVTQQPTLRSDSLFTERQHKYFLNLRIRLYTNFKCFRCLVRCFISTKEKKNIQKHTFKLTAHLILIAKQININHSNFKIKLTTSAAYVTLYFVSPIPSITHTS